MCIFSTTRHISSYVCSALYSIYENDTPLLVVRSSENEVRVI